MRLNLKDIINIPGAARPFMFQLDLSNLDFNGARPIDQPISVIGQVRNMGGALVLSGTAVTTLHLVCDRCSKPFARTKELSIETLLASELADEESESEIFLMDGDELDLDELVTTVFVLAMDTKNLCSEDCKGICAGCGADLNVELCWCTPEVDPRLASLAKLLEDKSE